MHAYMHAYMHAHMHAYLQAALLAPAGRPADGTLGIARLRVVEHAQDQLRVAPQRRMAQLHVGIRAVCEDGVDDCVLETLRPAVDP